MKKYVAYLGLIIVLLFSYWSIAPLLLSGFFPMHDDTQVARVQQMAKSLMDGMFPVRWVADLGYGYGYPIFTFYEPLAYYIGAKFMFFGASALLATKLMILVGVLLSGVTMYLLARYIWGEAGGIVSALLYVYAPYHAVNIYVRGAIGEAYGYALIPLVFYGLLKVYETGKFRFVVIGSLGYALLLLSHNLMAMITTPFVIAVLLFLTFLSLRKQGKKPFYFLQLIIIFGLTLSAFYWIPALLEMNYTNVISQVGGAADFREHFVCLPQLWDSPWGFGGSAKGCLDGLSFKIGKIHILFISLALLATPFFIKKRDKKRTVILLTSLFFLLLSIFFTLDVSKPIWKAFPLLAFVQYPWRFLTLVSFFASFAAGAVLWVLTDSIPVLKKSLVFKLLIASGISLGIIVVNAKLFVPQKILHNTSDYYTNNNMIRYTSSRISDEYLPKDFAKPLLPSQLPTNKFTVLKGNITIDSVSERTQELEAAVRASTESQLLVNIAYFPAWQIKIDDQVVPYGIQKNGLLVTVPKGVHQLRISYISTGIEWLANTVSLISVSLLIVGIIVCKRKGII